MAAGHKTGGRRPGSLNKRTLECQAAVAAVPPGESPLEFLTNVYRNPAPPLEARIHAAGKAAAYVHPRLTAVTVGGDKEKPLPIVPRIEIVPVARGPSGRSPHNDGPAADGGAPARRAAG